MTNALFADLRLARTKLRIGRWQTLSRWTFSLCVGLLWYSVRAQEPATETNQAPAAADMAIQTNATFAADSAPATQTNTTVVDSPANAQTNVAAAADVPSS